MAKEKIVEAKPIDEKPVGRVVEKKPEAIKRFTVSVTKNGVTYERSPEDAAKLVREGWKYV